MQVRTRYRAQPMAAGTSYKVAGAGIGGFLPTVNGTLSVTDADGTVLVDTLPVTAGIFVEIPLYFNTSQGGTVALTTAAGTLMI